MNRLYATEPVPYHSDCSHRDTKKSSDAKSWGLAYRSKGEIAVAQALHQMNIPFAYEPRLDLCPTDDPVNTYRAIGGVVYTRPDFYLLNGSGLVIEYAGMLDHAGYQQRHHDKLDLYTANGVACVEVLPEHLRDGRLPVSVLETMIADSLLQTSTPRHDLESRVRRCSPTE